jgi:hypothetical protein
MSVAAGEFRDTPAIRATSDASHSTAWVLCARIGECAGARAPADLVDARAAAQAHIKWRVQAKRRAP